MAALLCLQNRTGGSPPMGGGFFNQHNGDFCISRGQRQRYHPQILCLFWLKDRIHFLYYVELLRRTGYPLGPPAAGAPGEAILAIETSGRFVLHFSLSP